MSINYTFVITTLDQQPLLDAIAAHDWKHHLEAFAVDLTGRNEPHAAHGLIVGGANHLNVAELVSVLRHASGDGGWPCMWGLAWHVELEQEWQTWDYERHGPIPGWGETAPVRYAGQVSHPGYRIARIDGQTWLVPE